MFIQELIICVIILLVEQLIHRQQKEPVEQKSDETCEHEAHQPIVAFKVLMLLGLERFDPAYGVHEEAKDDKVCENVKYPDLGKNLVVKLGICQPPVLVREAACRSKNHIKVV